MFPPGIIYGDAAIYLTLILLNVFISQTDSKLLLVTTEVLDLNHKSRVLKYGTTVNLRLIYE